MTGVLHPIGPEPERIYWIRRVVLLAVVIVLVGGLIGVASTFGRGSTPVAGTAAAETSTASTPSATTPTASATPASTATPAAGTTPTPTPSASASSSGTGKPSATESKKTSSAKSTSPSATSSPSTSATAPAPSLCAASQLSSRISGDRTLKVDENTTFTVSLTNGGTAPCTLAVAASTFELKIYSGTDRIWSTKDCSSAIEPTTAVVKAGQAMTWQQDWNGRRSASNCKKGAEMPRPGVYWATAQYAGAKPTQLRMIIS